MSDGVAIGKNSPELTDSNVCNVYKSYQDIWTHSWLNTYKACPSVPRNLRSKEDTSDTYQWQINENKGRYSGHNVKLSIA